MLGQVGGARKHTMFRSTIRHLSRTSSQLSNCFRALPLKYNGHRLATSSCLDRLRDILIIQQAKNQEDFEYVERLCIKMNWTGVGAHMISHMGPVIKPGFLIGWLNGQRIGCVCATTFGEIDDGFSFFGFNLLEESYRGMGMGLQLTVALIECVGRGWNVVLNVNPNLKVTQRYDTFFGITEKLRNKEYILLCSRIIDTLQPEHGLVRTVTIKPIDQIDIDKLSVYDTSVFGFPRREFLKRWITIPQSTGFVATNENNGDIVGYGVMQPALINDKEQIIGPLFSDNESITRSLLYTLAKAAIDPQMGGADKMRLTVPTEINPGAADLLENKIGSDFFCDKVLLYSNDVPPSQTSAESMNNIVSQTSQVFG